MIFRDRNDVCKVKDFKYLIIDTDGGGDDCQALILLDHFAKKYNKKILGITTVDGNALLENVITNVLITQAVMGTNYPLYKGSGCSLHGKNLKDNFFGEDALGLKQKEYLQKYKVDRQLIQKQKAFKFIADSAAKYKGQIALIMIGPTTNLALAYHYNNQITHYFTNISIMGGADTLAGNFHFYTSQFNNALDAEASNCVFKKFNNILLCTFDSSILGIDSSKIDHLFLSKSTAKAHFIKDIYEYFQNKNPPIEAVVCDPCSVGILFRPDIIKQGMYAKLDVHIKGNLTRGCTTIDYLSPESHKHNCYIVKQFHIEKLCKYIEESYQ